MRSSKMKKLSVFMETISSKAAFGAVKAFSQTLALLSRLVSLTDTDCDFNLLTLKHKENFNFYFEIFNIKKLFHF